MTERVRVTSPRRTGARRDPRTVAKEIDDQSPLGELYLRSLLRTQLRLALVVLALLVVLVGGLPLFFTLAPDLAGRRVLGVTVAWALLGFVAYPVLFGLGWFFVRSAERNERDFADVVEKP